MPDLHVDGSGVLTVALSREQVWAVYDLTMAKTLALEAAEEQALMSLGSTRYRRAAEALKEVLDA